MTPQHIYQIKMATCKVVGKEVIMAESKLHDALKMLFATPYGQTEVPVGRSSRMDAQSPFEDVEIELSGNFIAAAGRLAQGPHFLKRMVVFDCDINAALNAMRLMQVSGTVQSLSGTAYRV
jgi:hypothetical protein